MEKGEVIMQVPLAERFITLFHDVDLSIFGASDDVFDLYERRIREEYQYVKSEKVFAMVRFQDRYESQARHNLARSIDQLLSSYDIAS